MKIIKTEILKADREYLQMLFTVDDPKGGQVTVTMPGGKLENPHSPSYDTFAIRMDKALCNAILPGVEYV